jgi:hypothetical protein
MANATGATTEGNERTYDMFERPCRAKRNPAPHRWDARRRTP